MRVGDWVEVKSAAEILRTLDAQGAFEGMPFMPEMLAFCGRRFQIRKSAHKTCDSISHKARCLTQVVHLDTRCSGDAHGRCMAGCLLFWKEAWLSAVEGPASAPVEQRDTSNSCPPPATHEARARLLNTCCVAADDGAIRYRCQATQILQASGPLPWWDLRQYVNDLRSGNLSLGDLLRGTCHAAWMALIRIRPLSSLVHSCYEHLRFLWQGNPFPRRVGSILCGERTPVSALGLRPGELVRVRPIDEIDRTLDRAGQNRGLYFDPEQVPYANGTFRVLHRVDRIISESTGEMLQIKTPTVVLDAVVCRGQHSSCRMYCPRSSYLFWREAWLERADTPALLLEDGSIGDR